MRTALVRLRRPSSLVLIAVNAIPVIGILLWHWDAFQLLILYWMETVVLGFWAIVLVALSPAKALGPFATGKSRLGIIPFLILHSGIFMGVHFVFLWELFAGGWASRVHGLGDFFRLIEIEQKLWLPLLLLFLVQGLVVTLTVLEPKWIPGWRPQSVILAAQDEGAFPVSGPLFGFYVRIIIIQFALIFGGGIAVLVGAVLPLILLVVIKTAIDLGLFLNVEDRVAASITRKSTAP